MRRAVTSEHFALFALTLTNPTNMPAYRFRRFMFIAAATQDLHTKARLG
jgi:hypothetical protein